MKLACLKSDRKVGIGTTDPSQLLDIYSDNSTVNPTFHIRENAARDSVLILERTDAIWQFLIELI